MFATSALSFTASLALAIALTLCTKVISEHRAEDEVFFRCELVKRAGYNQADGVETFLASEVEVDVVPACRLHYIVNVLPAEPLCNKWLVFL